MSTKKHYTECEKRFFIQIIKQFSHIIEKKKSDTTTLKDKDEAWNDVCRMYNGSSVVSAKRTVQQLKKYWSNLKATQRTAITFERQARLATGGGPQPGSAEIDPEIAVITPHLMTTAPSIFSSNVAAEKSQERGNAIVDEVIRPEDILEAEDNANSDVDALIFDDSAIEQDVDCNNEYKEDIVPNFVKSTPPRKRSAEDALGTSRTVTKKPKNSPSTSRSEEEELFRVERIRKIIQREEELVQLKFENEVERHHLEMERNRKILERDEELFRMKFESEVEKQRSEIKHLRKKQNLEIEHLREKHALEIVESTGATELA